MLNEHALREALAGAGVSAPVRFDEVTGSTNATAVHLANEGAPEWTLVGAGHQTAGRGRLDRQWEDRPGSALLFSIVLRPQAPVERAGLLPLLAGLCMARACRRACGVNVACKWPNDLLVDEGKVGGILAESRMAGGTVEHVVVGIGVNLREPPEAVPGSAGLGGCDGASLLAEFVADFRRMYRPAHPAFVGAVVTWYREICRTLGQRVRATTVDGGTVEGMAMDVDDRGDLIVDTGSGLQSVAFGEVVHLDR